jgi:hypothetical protein
MELLAALAGAIVGSLVTIVWDRLRVPKRLRNALSAELAANRRICETSLAINRPTLASLSINAGEDPIDDDFKVYVVAPLNLSLETWVNQDSATGLRKVTLEDLLAYKSAVMRVEYLVDRHRAFRFRPNFVRALVDSHEKLLSTIQLLQGKV